MGLDDVDLPDDADGGGGTGKVSAAESCSICLETVIRNGDRSWAMLQCGHEFHLDCIGSAFNIKGAMQCPNCRKVEKGQWLYASGHRSLPEFSMDDWAHDEDLYDLSYSEMSFGVHWCPFSGLTRLPSSFDEGDFSSAYHDLIRQHALLAEHAAVSSATHQCPYIAYVGIHPSSSNSSGGVSDAPTFNNHWNGPSIPHEVPTYAFPGMDVHYDNWDHHSSPFPTTSTRIGNTDQPSIPSVPHRAARTTTDIPRQGSFVHPFLVSHSPAARAGSSVASSMIPPYPGSVARARDRVQALQAYFQQPSNSPGVRAPVVLGARRSGSHHRGMAQVSPMASSSDQPGGGFYFYPPPSSSSGRSFQESENRFPIWEQRETHMPASSLSQVEPREPIWGSSFHHGAGGSDPPAGIRFNGFRQRHGSERMPSQHRS